MYNIGTKGFWTEKGDRVTVIGDNLGRIPAIAMLAPHQNEHILEVGCGAGWCTRRVARLGAKVSAFDRAMEMLAAAEKSEKDDPLGIVYWHADLRDKWEVASGSKDAVVCIAVLMHSTPEEAQHFFREARRVLKPNGRLVVSVSHRELLRQHETGLKLGWVWYEPGVWDAAGNGLAVEHYYDSQGNESVPSSPVWMHNLRLATERAGFKILQHHDRVVTREALVEIHGEQSANWPIGYSAMEQVLAVP